MAEEKKNGAVATPERAPLRPFEALEREFQEMRRRMLDIFRRPFAMPYVPVLPAAGEWTPTVDAYEVDGTLVVKAELPGVKTEDISITVEDGLLTITGRREQEEKVEKARYYAWERFTGAFTRRFTLPDGVDPGAIAAAFKDGVLEVKVPLPKSVTTQPVKIPVTG